MSENISAEEMRKGTEPSRQELIMGTPVQAVLEKESWNDVDVEVLVMHQHLLDDETKAKLGLAPVPVKTPEQVASETAQIKQDAVTAEAAANQKAAQEDAAEAQRKAEAEAAEKEAATKTVTAPTPEEIAAAKAKFDALSPEEQAKVKAEAEAAAKNAAPVVDNKTE